MYCVLLTSTALAFKTASAAGTYDAGSLLRDIEQTKARQIPNAPTPPNPAVPAESKSDETTVTVTRFEFSGNTLVSNSELDATLAAWRNKAINFQQLQQVTLIISQRYQEKGWLAKAVLPEQAIENGIIQIRIIEAQLGELHLENTDESRASHRLIRHMIQRASSIGEKLNLRALEKSLLLVNDLPGVAAKAILAEGKQNNETDIALQITDEPLFNPRAWVDNYGSRYTGSLRWNGLAQLNNISGWGDQLSLQVMHSKGTDFIQGQISVPVGYAGTRLGLRGSVLDYTISGGNLSAIEAKGDASIAAVFATHPLYRSQYTNVRLGVDLESKYLKDYALGLEVNDKKLRTFDLALHADNADGLGLGGITWAGFTARTGKADLSGNQASLNADKVTAQVNGYYNKLNFYLGRQQKIADQWLLQGLLSAQWTDRNLDSAEKFSLGGPSGLAAFAVGEGRADLGWMFNLEARHALNTSLTARIFGDAGGVCLNKKPWTTFKTSGQDNCYQLADVGFGLGWQHEKFDARMSYARKISSNKGLDQNQRDVEGRRTNHQLWLQIDTAF